MYIRNKPFFQLILTTKLFNSSSKQISGIHMLISLKCFGVNFNLTEKGLLINGFNIVQEDDQYLQSFSTQKWIEPQVDIFETIAQFFTFKDWTSITIVALIDVQIFKKTYSCTYPVQFMLIWGNLWVTWRLQYWNRTSEDVIRVQILWEWKTSSP